MRRVILVLTCLAAVLVGCDATVREAAVVAPVDAGGPDPVQEPTDVKYYPSDEPVRMGLEQFNRGNYGIAQRYFKDGVEKSPKDLTAWIGLAASYDRKRRFDLADQAYSQAIRLGGRAVKKNPKEYSALDVGWPLDAGVTPTAAGMVAFLQNKPNFFSWIQRCR